MLLCSGTSPLHTDYAIQAYRPDIEIKDFKKLKCYFIDMIIHPDKEHFGKEFDKLSKYEDLKIEIARMWNLNTATISV